MKCSGFCWLAVADAGPGPQQESHRHRVPKPQVLRRHIGLARIRLEHVTVFVKHVVNKLLSRHFWTLMNVLLVLVLEVGKDWLIFNRFFDNCGQDVSCIFEYAHCSYIQLWNKYIRPFSRYNIWCFHDCSVIGPK